MAPTHHRLLALLATILAAVALAATPALASEPEDDDDEEAPAQVLPPAPTPVPPFIAPAPAAPPAPPAPSVRQRRKVRGEHRTAVRRPATRRRVVTVRLTRSNTGRVVAQTVPRGGVQAGAGGMAPGGTDGGLLGFAAGTLVLLAGGGLIARGRREGP